MSMRYQAGILTASYFPLKVPDAPTAVTATQASATSVSVAFTAPADVGGGAITSYLVVSSGGQTASGSSSPITVSGLTSGTTYTFVVYAINAFGTGPASAASNSVTPSVVGQQAYTTAGTYSWVAPTGVTSVSVVAIGGGTAGGGNGVYGGGAGGLGYKNNISVVAGNSYTVVVASGGATNSGGTSYFIGTGTVAGYGGVDATGGGYTGDGGGYGGNGTGGGGGAGGVSGGGESGGGGGGGVGVLGQGADGAAGVYPYGGGGGGSGGAAGVPTAGGGAYGGGGAGNYGGTNGGKGAVRIIWSTTGATRSFPSTNTGNL